LTETINGEVKYRLIFPKASYSIPQKYVKFYKGKIFNYGTGDTVLVDLNKRNPRLRFLHEGTGEKIIFGIDLVHLHDPKIKVELAPFIKIIYINKFLELMKFRHRAD
jgi:hypothetical protein